MSTNKYELRGFWALLHSAICITILVVFGGWQMFAIYFGLAFASASLCSILQHLSRYPQ